MKPGAPLETTAPSRKKIRAVMRQNK